MHCQHPGTSVRTVRRNACESGPVGLFHLSTRMCAAHRLLWIKRIRRCLKANRTCRVVSTQLIEAGVDVDFPVVFRALAPLDSILQSAGRADREARPPQSLSLLLAAWWCFCPRSTALPPGAYEEAAKITEVLAKTRSIQPDDWSIVQSTSSASTRRRRSSVPTFSSTGWSPSSDAG